MEPFTQITSHIIPLPLNDIDTDMIIPAEYLTSISKEGYGENVFRRLRDENPNFPLNQERYHSAQILLAQHNFGCGSSREHAVWALMGWGIRVVIASSFADIFKSNSGKNGLVLIELPEETIAQLHRTAAEDDLELTVDLAEQTLTLTSGDTHNFPYDPFRKTCILKGYDDLDYLLDHRDPIKAYQQKRNNQLFYQTTEPNHPEAMKTA